MRYGKIMAIVIGLCVLLVGGSITVKAESVTYDYGTTAKATLDDSGMLTVTGQDSIYQAGNIKNAIGSDNVSKVKKLVVAGNITTLYSYNFAALPNLTEVVIGDNVTSIDMNTFENDLALESIELGAGVKNFRLSSKVQKVLKEVKVSSDSPYLKVVNGVLFTKDMKELMYYPVSLEDESYAIPDTVETIGYQAFRYVQNLKTIIIPDSVKTISSYAFQYCDYLDELVVPESVNKLEYGSFMNAGARRIIYKGTANPGERCFDSCTNLKYLEITSEDIDNIGYCAVCDCKNLQEVVLPESMRTIGIRSFENDSSLKYINSPSELEKIDSGAFYKCGSLKNFTFPRSVIYVGATAFDGTQVTNRPSWLTVTGNGSYSTMISINYTGTVDYNEALSLLERVNNYREENGCDRLVIDSSLSSGAVLRSEELPILLDSGRLDRSDGVKVSDKAEMQLYCYGNSTEEAFNYLTKKYKSELEKTKYTSCGIACFYQGYSKYYSLLFSSSDGDNAKKVGQQYVRVNRDCEYNVITDKSFGMMTDLSSITVGASKRVVFGVREYDNLYWYEYYKNRILKLNPDSFLYDTSDHKIATISSDGTITGHSSGECKLYIYAKETKKWCKVYDVTVSGEGNDGYTEQNTGEKGDGEEKPQIEDSEELDEDDDKPYYNNETDIYTSGSYYYEDAFEHLKLLNEMRAENGLEPLVMDKQLLEAAMVRSAECLIYYEHIRPCNKSLRELCNYADGENIALGAKSPSQALRQFYNDKPHRDNMLSADWKSVGIGVFVQGDMVYYVQDFSSDEAHEGVTDPERGVEKVFLSIPCYTGYATRDKFIYSAIGTMKIGESEKIQIKTYNFIDDEWGTSTGIVPDNKTFDFVNKTPDIIDVDENGVVTAKASGNWKVVAKLPSNSDIRIICVGGITEFGSGYDSPLTKEEYDADMGKFIDKSDNSDASQDSKDDNKDVGDDNSNSGTSYRDESPTQQNNDDKGGSIVNKDNPNTIEDNSNYTLNGENSQADTNNNNDSRNNNTSNGGNKIVVVPNNNVNGESDDIENDDYDYYVPAKVNGLKVVNKKTRKLKITWKNILKADGYQIQYAKNRKFTKEKRTKYSDDNAITIKNLSKKKTYYVRVRAFAYDSDGDKVYGGWSNTIGRKIKK